VVAFKKTLAPSTDGDWDGWPEWPGPDGGPARFPYYTIKL
jgi:hypothetical protein